MVFVLLAVLLVYGYNNTFISNTLWLCICVSSFVIIMNLINTSLLSLLSISLILCLIIIEATEVVVVLNILVLFLT